jgi:hypothetical protein
VCKASWWHFEKIFFKLNLKKIIVFFTFLWHNYILIIFYIYLIKGYFMALEKTEKEKFTLLTYYRKGIEDVEIFKRTLASLAFYKEEKKDIIIDLSLCKMLTSTEIGAMVRLANQLKGSLCILRIISSDELYKQFESIKLTQLEHLCIYKNKEEFKKNLTNKI